MNNGPQAGVIDAAGDERAHHLLGQVGVGQVAKTAKLGGRKLRPAVRHVKPAVTGQAGHKNVVEGERRRRPARADIFHCPSLSRPAAIAARAATLARLGFGCNNVAVGNRETEQ